MGNEPLTLLIADRESLIARRLKEYLADKGVICDIVGSGKQLKEKLRESVPNFILIDLLLPDCSPLELLGEIKKNPALKNVKVMVTSGHNSAKNVKQIFLAGASDYIVKPFKLEDILGRIVFQLQKTTRSASSDTPDTITFPESTHYLHLAELVLKEATSSRNAREKLFHLMQMLALSMKAVRCSVIRTDMLAYEGTVVASSDDIRVKKIIIDLQKYPEVLHTVNTGKTTIIENLEFNPELARLKKIVKTISFNSIIVNPVIVNGEVFGVVSARMDSKAQKFSDLQVRFSQLISDVCCLVVNSVDFLPYIEPQKAKTEDASEDEAA